MKTRRLVALLLLLALLCCGTARAQTGAGVVSDGVVSDGRVRGETVSDAVLSDAAVKEAGEPDGAVSDGGLCGEMMTLERPRPGQGEASIYGYVDMGRDPAPVAADWEPPMLLSLPTSYDLRDYGFVSPDVRNQNPYGTCWAFSGAAVAESSLLKKGYAAMDLSELQLVYFTYVRDAAAMATGSGTAGDIVMHDGDILNRGGNTYFAAMAMTNWLGLIPESDMPYTSVEAKATVTGRTVEAQYAMNVDLAHMRGFYWVPLSATTNRGLVKSMLQEYGAASVSYFHDNTCFNSATDAYYQNVYGYSNHAVTLVGWDDEFSRENFKEGRRPTADGAWLIRNSWGPYWGDNGYFWISYEDPSIRFAIFMELSGAEEFDQLYQYDGGLWNDGHYIRVPDSTTPETRIYTGNVFTAERAETLSAVGFFSEDTNMDISVQVYTGLPAQSTVTDPTAGTLRFSKDVETPYEGYYTVDLTTPVTLGAGDVFSVVLTIVDRTVGDGDDKMAVFFADGSLDMPPIYSRPTATAKQSFIRGENSTVWEDISQSATKNLRIKAMTKRTGSVRGDLDLDDDFRLNDVIYAARYVAGLQRFTAARAARADFDGDGTVTVADLVLMRRVLAGIAE